MEKAPHCVGNAGPRSSSDARSSAPTAPQHDAGHEREREAAAGAAARGRAAAALGITVAGWGALVLAGRRAAVAAGVVAIVTLFGTAHDAVAAAGRRLVLAGGGAAVACGGVAVVALLALLDLAVAAHRPGRHELADDADVVEGPAGGLEAVVAVEVEGHLDLSVGGERRQVDVLEAPLLVDVVHGGAVVGGAVGAGEVAPRRLAVDVDRRVIEAGVLDAEPAPVVEADVGVAGDVDLRRPREAVRARLVLAVEAAAAAEIDAEDAGPRHRRGRVAAGAARRAPLPLVGAGHGAVGPVGRIALEVGAVDLGDRADVELVERVGRVVREGAAL